MADMFSSCDAIDLLRNKHVLFLGDSNIRAQYKDLIWLLKLNTLIEKKPLRSKLEESFLGDSLMVRSKLHYGRDFQEARYYYDSDNETAVEFIFLTRCYNHRIERLFADMQSKGRPIPDVIVMNSCLWDLTRWGPNGVPEYKDNMMKLMRLMSRVLPKTCLVIWTTALPTAPHVKGGLIIKQIEFIEPMLRFEVMEANSFARDVVVRHGFDVLDSHYYTRMQMHRRAKDGVHYLPIPVRFMTNLLLTHITLTWDMKLPQKVQSVLLDKAIALDNKPMEPPEVKIPKMGIFSKINLPSPVLPKIRGLAVTFNAQEYGKRKCSLFENKLSAPSFSEDQQASTRLRSVVQVPQDMHQRHAATGPSRRRKKNKKKHHPYQNYQEPSNLTTQTQNGHSYYTTDSQNGYSNYTTQLQNVPSNYTIQAQNVPYNYTTQSQNVPYNYTTLSQNVPYNYTTQSQNGCSYPSFYNPYPNDDDAYYNGHYSYRH